MRQLTALRCRNGTICSARSALGERNHPRTRCGSRSHWRAAAASDGSNTGLLSSSSQLAASSLALRGEPPLRLLLLGEASALDPSMPRWMPRWPGSPRHRHRGQDGMRRLCRRSRSTAFLAWRQAGGIGCSPAPTLLRVAGATPRLSASAASRSSSPDERPCSSPQLGWRCSVLKCSRNQAAFVGLHRTDQPVVASSTRCSPPRAPPGSHRHC